MAEMKEHNTKEREEKEKKFEDKLTVRSEAYFTMSIKPAKIFTKEEIEAKEKSGKKDGDIKLFDFGGQTEAISESFAASKQSENPLEGPKFYLNICFSDDICPPMTR